MIYCSCCRFVLFKNRNSDNAYFIWFPLKKIWNIYNYICCIIKYKPGRWELSFCLGVNENRIQYYMSNDWKYFPQASFWHHIFRPFPSPLSALLVPGITGHAHITMPPLAPPHWMVGVYLETIFILRKVTIQLLTEVTVNFFFFFFLNLFIYLFIFGCVGSSFLCEGFL